MCTWKNRQRVNPEEGIPLLRCDTVVYKKQAKQWMGEIENLAKKLAEEYLKTSPQVRPKSVTAACAYLACVAKGKRTTQEGIAREHGVSAPTVRKVYKDILRTISSIGDEDYQDLRREIKFEV